MKKNFIIGLILIGFIGFFGNNLTTNADTKKPQVQQAKTTVQKATLATPLNIVADPNKYLNKTVKMQATFDKFSTLGLDYKKALRPSSEYIGILIQRDNVVDNNIPLSEMKLFLKRFAESLTMHVPRLASL